MRKAFGSGRRDSLERQPVMLRKQMSALVYIGFRSWVRARKWRFGNAIFSSSWNKHEGFGPTPNSGTARLTLKITVSRC